MIDENKAVVPFGVKEKAQDENDFQSTQNANDEAIRISQDAVVALQTQREQQNLEPRTSESSFLGESDMVNIDRDFNLEDHGFDSEDIQDIDHDSNDDLTPENEEGVAKAGDSGSTQATPSKQSDKGGKSILPSISDSLSPVNPNTKKPRRIHDSKSPGGEAVPKSSSTFESMIFEDWQINKFNGFKAPPLDKILNTRTKTMDSVWSQSTPNIGQTLFFHNIDYEVTYVTLLFESGMFLPQSINCDSKLFKSRVPNPSDGVFMEKVAISLQLKSGGHTMERYGLLIREAIFKQQPGQMYIFDGHPQVLSGDINVHQPPSHYRVITDVGSYVEEPYALHSPALSPDEKKRYYGNNLSVLVQHKTRLCLALYLSFTDAGTFIDASDCEEEKEVQLSGAMAADFDSFLTDYKRFISEKSIVREMEVPVRRMIFFRFPSGSFPPFPSTSLPSQSFPSVSFHSFPFLPFSVLPFLSLIFHAIPLLSFLFFFVSALFYHSVWFPFISFHSLSFTFFPFVYFLPP